MWPALPVRMILLPEPLVRVMVLALWRFIAPAALLPIVTAPVLVPVLMLVALLELALRLTAAPVTVRPALPVNSCVEVKAPLLVVVTPALPSVIALALPVPILIVPVVPVAV